MSDYPRASRSPAARQRRRRGTASTRQAAVAGGCERRPRRRLSVDSRFYFLVTVVVLVGLGGAGADARTTGDAVVSSNGESSKSPSSSSSSATSSLSPDEDVWNALVREAKSTFSSLLDNLSLSIFDWRDSSFSLADLEHQLLGQIGRRRNKRGLFFNNAKPTPIDVAELVLAAVMFLSLLLLFALAIDALRIGAKYIFFPVGIKFTRFFPLELQSSLTKPNGIVFPPGEKPPPTFIPQKPSSDPSPYASYGIYSTPSQRTHSGKYPAPESSYEPPETNGRYASSGSPSSSYEPPKAYGKPAYLAPKTSGGYPSPGAFSSYDAPKTTTSGKYPSAPSGKSSGGGSYPPAVDSHYSRDSVGPPSSLLRRSDEAVPDTSTDASYRVPEDERSNSETLSVVSVPRPTERRQYASPPTPLVKYSNPYAIENLAGGVPETTEKPASSTAAEEHIIKNS